MKIVQICLCGPYNPQFGYQDNILPKYYKSIGFDCVTVASQHIYGRSFTRCRKITIEIENSNRIIRLPDKFGFLFEVNLKLRLFSGLFKVLTDEKPDILFIHSLQFLSLKSIIRYCKRHKEVRVYVDNHADYVNSASTWISKHILHEIIWRYFAKLIEPYAIKFWGVTEQRCQFLHEVYKIPKEKIDLLVMGADDEIIEFSKTDIIRRQLREELGFSINDFLVVTGGKIDSKKNIHLLMEAIKKIGISEIKLLIFGSVDKEFANTFDSLLECENIKYIGWLEADKVYDYYLASDLGVFPGTHSVLWEQAVGTGLPCVFKSWNGMHHVDVGGNCVFLERDSADEIKSAILDIYNNKQHYEQMKRIAVEKGIVKFSYSEIAKKSIDFREKNSCREPHEQIHH